MVMVVGVNFGLCRRRVAKRGAPWRGPMWGSNRSVGDAARRFRYLREQTRAMAAVPERSEAGRGGDGASHGGGRERDFERKKKDFGSTTPRVPESSLTSVLTQHAGA